MDRDKSIEELKEEITSLEEQEKFIAEQEARMEEIWECELESRQRIEKFYSDVLSGGEGDKFYQNIGSNYDEISNYMSKIKYQIEDSLEEMHDDRLKLLTQLNEKEEEYKKL